MTDTRAKWMLRTNCSINLWGVVRRPVYQKGVVRVPRFPRFRDPEKSIRVVSPNRTKVLGPSGSHHGFLSTSSPTSTSSAFSHFLLYNDAAFLLWLYSLYLANWCTYLRKHKSIILFELYSIPSRNTRCTVPQPESETWAREVDRSSDRPLCVYFSSSFYFVDQDLFLFRWPAMAYPLEEDGKFSLSIIPKFKRTVLPL